MVTPRRRSTNDGRTRSRPARWQPSVTSRTGLAVLVAVLSLTVVAPDPVPTAAARLAALATAVTGAWLLVGRGGVIDLAAAATLGTGAVWGGVGSALLELPSLVGVGVGAVAGAAIGGLAGAVHGRVGRAAGALASLAFGLAVVAATGTWEPLAGAGGFHAVGLPAPGGPRVEAAAVGAVLIVVSVIVAALAGSRTVGAASGSVRAPAFAAASGRRPWLAVAQLGAMAGAALGAGGALLAAVDGSVVPGAYGLELTAAIVLAALLGGVPPLGPAVGVLLVWGPGTVLPLVPVVGTSPPLLLMGPVGLAVLFLRHGRPVVGRAAASTPDAAPATAGSPSAGSPPAPLPAVARRRLRLRSLATPSGAVSADVGPGEILAVVGPNGAGKSTLLARIGGQLPDGGGVGFGDAPAPRGAVARARAGLARTWQHPPQLAAPDLAALRPGTSDADMAAAWATQVVCRGHDPTTCPDLTHRHVVQLVARRPAIALLDEPTGLDLETLRTVLHGLAAMGAAVVLVDHRSEVLALAGHRVELGERR